MSLSQLGTKFSEISYNSFRSRKCIWICTQQNLGQELGHQQTQCWTQSYHIKAENDGHHFPEDIFRCIFLKENEWISIKISLKLVPKGSINNIPSLVQIMAWRWPGNKPLSEPMMVSLLMHICVTWPQWLTRLSLKVLYFIMANDISWYIAALQHPIIRNIDGSVHFYQLLTTYVQQCMNYDPFLP